MIVMTLLVRDEADVLAPNIEHHLDIGVDHVLVTDHRSVDATVDILAAYERAGVATVWRAEEPAYLQAQWVTTMARRAAEMGAAWVINSDADEFWWPVGGDLPTVLGAAPGDADGLEVPRVNLVGDTTASAPWHRRLRHRQRVSVNHLGAPLPPKVCHRGHPDVYVSMGNHAASWDGFRGVVSTPELSILHVPVRTRSQFSHKIEVGGDALAQSTFGPKTGVTWRQLRQRQQGGGFDEVLARQAPDAGAVADLVARGELVSDDRLYRRVEELHARSRVPEAMALG